MSLGQNARSVTFRVYINPDIKVPVTLTVGNEAGEVIYPGQYSSLITFPEVVKQISLDLDSNSIDEDVEIAYFYFRYSGNDNYPVPLSLIRNKYDEYENSYYFGSYRNNILCVFAGPMDNGMYREGRISFVLNSGISSIDGEKSIYCYG